MTLFCTFYKNIIRPAQPALLLIIESYFMLKK